MKKGRDNLMNKRTAPLIWWKKPLRITLVPKSNIVFGISIFCGVELIETFLFSRYFTSYFVKKILKKNLRKSHRSVDAHNSVHTLPLAFDVTSITDRGDDRSEACYRTAVE